MNNMVCIIGRLVSEPIVNEESENKETTITLAVNRNYKNADGIYETDFIPAILWNGIATNAKEYLKKGDLVGIKGKLESKTTEDNKNSLCVIAEKLTFLSSKEPDENNGE